MDESTPSWPKRRRPPRTDAIDEDVPPFPLAKQVLFKGLPLTLKEGHYEPGSFLAELTEPA